MTRVSSKSISKPHSSKPAAKPAKKAAATKKPAAKTPRHADKFEAASGRGKRTTREAGGRYAIIDRSSTSSSQNADLRRVLNSLGGGGRSSGDWGGGGGYGGGGSGS